MFFKYSNYKCMQWLLNLQYFISRDVQQITIVTFVIETQRKSGIHPWLKSTCTEKNTKSIGTVLLLMFYILNSQRGLQKAHLIASLRWPIAPIWTSHYIWLTGLVDILLMLHVKQYVFINIRWCSTIAN